MSYSWKRIGNFESATDAERWCLRQGIDRRDFQVRETSQGVELTVREEADYGKEDRPGRRGFGEF